MIHFTCDCCHRTIDPDKEVRYVVRMEVYAAIDSTDEDTGAERDHLEEIDEIIERLDSAGEEVDDADFYQQERYDLCADCRAQVARNPLGRLAAAKLGFSKN